MISCNYLSDSEVKELVVFYSMQGLSISTIESKLASLDAEKMANNVTSARGEYTKVLSQICEACKNPDYLYRLQDGSCILMEDATLNQTLAYGYCRRVTFIYPDGSQGVCEITSDENCPLNFLTLLEMLFADINFL